MAPRHDLWQRVLTSHPLVRLLRHALSQLNRPGYLVGGIVRDILLFGEETEPGSFDLDVVVLGDPQAVVRVLQQQGLRVTRKSPFHTLRLEGPPGKLDLAMARTETYPEPAALPQVQPAQDLAQDLARRDFTINSMALELHPRFGHLHDPFGGAHDLQEGWIRVLHPGSFRDDPTRAFRAVRYRVRFGFRYSPETEREFDHARRYMHRLSFERVQNELQRIAQEPEPGRVMEEVAKLGLLQAYRAPWQPQPNLLKALHKVSLHGEQEWPVLLVPFLASAPEDLDSLPLKRQDRQMLETLLRILREPSPRSLAQAFDRYGRIPPRWLEIAGILKEDQILRDLAHRLREIHPCLRGNDLEALGLHGTEVGQALWEIRKQWVLGHIRSCEEEYRWIQHYLRNRR